MDGRALVVGWAGESFLFDGHDLTEVHSNTGVTLRCVCARSGTFYVAGDEGMFGEYAE